ncbi:MAG TPA: phosphotransferase [Stenotrophomonas sp.]|jgi:predicted hotdog family 3-hydroxylacyl-ACP dehydratase
MLQRDQIQALVPHAGAMCLWDQVLAWDADRIELAASNHGDAHHPLRSGGRLSAVHLCEYGAQAMAVHGGLLASAQDRRVRPGMLVSLRGVELHCVRIDDLPGELRCQARCLVQGQDSQQYQFRITHGDRCLAEGRAAVMLQSINEALR